MVVGWANHRVAQSGAERVQMHGLAATAVERAASNQCDKQGQDSQANEHGASQCVASYIQDRQDGTIRVSLGCGKCPIRGGYTPMAAGHSHGRQQLRTTELTIRGFGGKG